MEKVLATVVQTLGVFFMEFEGAKVFFKGSTPSRTRLYRIIIAKFHKDSSHNPAQGIPYIYSNSDCR